MKAKYTFKVTPNLPGPLEILRKLAYNLCFTWKYDIQAIFQRIDPGLWVSCNQNPVLMLGLVSQERLNELAQDQGFLAQLERVSKDFEEYLNQGKLIDLKSGSKDGILVAYFSLEYGLATCLPIYSGGLGILAGDHLKSSSDLNIPLVGVGLLYQEGYFSQYLTADGWQMETFPPNDFSQMPVRPVLDQYGSHLKVKVDFKGTPVDVLVWRTDVGRIPLFLLDTNTPSNPEEYRGTTAQLYGGDRDMRIRQEIVLGIGGIRALKAMGIEPTVVHMNEGHCAFTALERIRILRQEKGLSFDEAREMVLASSVFTTHTPVPAGNDTFDPELARAYFEEYAKELGINFKVLLGYGRVDPWNIQEPFGMTPLALRLSSHGNAVSRLHEKVSKDMWQKVWPRNPVEDIPISHITNGIHVPSWISEEMRNLLDRYFGPNWPEESDNETVWAHVDQIPPTELWRTHERCRERLIGFVRKRLAEQLKRRGASDKEILFASEVLSPDTLTIGFARRFATYKRATLLFSDPERLDKILNNPHMPVQIIVSGKAHPQDNEGKMFIQRIIHLTHQDRFKKKVVFIEDYNIQVAEALVSGCDLWLNTPRRPLEACGTSGMKAVANGCLHMSVLDGWWDEAYHSDFGWAIGRGETYQDPETQDYIESRILYNLLEKAVVPLFYQRGEDDVPRGWVEKMRLGLRRLVPVFNSNRMVQEYHQKYYVPCSFKYIELAKDGFKGAKELAKWRQKLMTTWHQVAVEEVTVMESLEKKVGEDITLRVRVRLGELTPEDVTVEAYYGLLDTKEEFVERETSELDPLEAYPNGYIFQGKIPCKATGKFGFTVRVTPSAKRLENRFTLALVTWA